MISAIIVARNAEKYIISCIKSIIKQFDEEMNWELIIVDGLSSDKTKILAEEYLNPLSIKYLILDNSKKTLASGWNLAIKVSKGEYVIRPDAHAELLDSYIMNGVEHLESNYELAAVGGTLITHSDSLMGNLIATVLSNPIGVGRSLFRTGIKSDTITETAVYAVYRKSIFNEVGYFNEDLKRNQDIELHQRITRSGYKFLTAANMKVIYYSRNTVSQYLKQGYQNGYWVMKSNAFHLNHLIPGFFVISIILAPVFSLKFLGLILLLHLFTAFISYACISKIINPIKLLVLELLTISLHFVYGFGSIVGFFIFLKKH